MDGEDRRGIPNVKLIFFCEFGLDIGGEEECGLKNVGTWCAATFSVLGLLGVDAERDEEGRSRKIIK